MRLGTEDAIILLLEEKHQKRCSQKVLPGKGQEMTTVGLATEVEHGSKVFWLQTGPGSAAHSL